MNEYFLIENGVQCGPFSEAMIRDKLSAGSLTDNDYIWWEGSADWVSISTAPQFQLPARKNIPERKIWLSRKIWLVGAALAAFLVVAALATFSFSYKRNKPLLEPALVEQVIILELFELKDKFQIINDGFEAVKVGKQFPSGPHFANMSYDAAMAEVRSIQAKVNQAVETQASAMALLAQISQEIMIWDGPQEIKPQIKKLCEIKQKDLEVGSDLRKAATQVDNILSYYVVQQRTAKNREQTKQAPAIDNKAASAVPSNDKVGVDSASASNDPEAKSVNRSSPVATIENQVIGNWFSIDGLPETLRFNIDGSGLRTIYMPSPIGIGDGNIPRELCHDISWHCVDGKAVVFLEDKQTFNCKIDGETLAVYGKGSSVHFRRAASSSEASGHARRVINEYNTENKKRSQEEANRNFNSMFPPP